MIGNYLIKKTILIVTGMVWLFAGNLVWADDSANIMDVVTVTAERFPVKEKESPHFVTVISSEDLKDSGVDNLSDAVKRIGGFSYKAYAPLGVSHGGMNSTVSIRGLKDGELVLINGSPIQGAAGHAYDLNTIPVEQIERIEILKGAASTLYGADAMSGVINIITKKPLQKTALGGSSEFGNEQYQNHSFSASLPNVNIGFNYSHLGKLNEISRSFTKKYRYDMDSTDKYAWNVNTTLMENLHLDYLGSYYETGFEKHFDGEKKPMEGTKQEHSKNFLNLRYEAKNFKAKLFGNYDEMRRDEYTSPGKPKDRNKNYNSGIEADYRFELSDWQLTIGSDWIYRGADYNNQYGRHHRNDYAPFVHVKKTFWQRLTATAGVREQFIDGESGTDSYARILPSFGLSFKTTEAINLYANAGKAFRSPTFNNLYYESSFMVGNPDLKPEEGWTYETGIKYDDDLFRLRLAAFYMTYKDKIEVDRSKGYPLTYFNAGDYASKGIEWETGVSPFFNNKGWIKNILFYTSGYWADPTADDTEGKKYQIGPKLQTNIGISCLCEPLTLDMNCQILSARERDLDGYAVLNLHAKYKLWKGYLTFAIDNVFNKEIQVSGDLSEGASNRYLYYEIGQLIKIGYEIAF